MRVPKYLGYLGNEDTHTTHTQTQQYTTTSQEHMHATTTTTPKKRTHNKNNKHTCMQQQPQQLKNPTPRTIIGHSPHPPTCVWVRWVFI